MAGHVVILVEPQLGENIGHGRRAMGQFGLTRLRIVNPRRRLDKMCARKRAAARGSHPG